MARRDAGFTVIEVLIVLAIAALIILIVFLAVPALQRNGRDTRRKHDLTLFYTLIKEYQNTQGSNATPFVNTATDTVKFNQFIDDYFSQETGRYTIEFRDVSSAHNFPYEADKMVYFPSHFCSTVPGEQVTQGSGIHPTYAWAVLVAIEGSDQYLCLDQGNQDI